MSDRRRRDDTVRAVDLFCGAGGLSWGLAQTCEHLDREVELAAVNHWETAIETHEQAHPWADHHHARVEELDPREVFPGERVDILTAGPECTHFSTARGGRPVDDQKRASPWHVLTWLQKLYVDNFVVENVPEFESWSPVGADGTPMKSKEGETFEAWINALHSLGYSVDWEVLNAADFGDATSRRRLFIIGRRQHRPEFPEPTHSENGKEPDTEPWRSAAEIIDWSEPGESIWERNRPLVSNTMQRIAEGIRRHAHDDFEPYADAVADLGKDDVAAMQEGAVPAAKATEAAHERDNPFLVKGPVPEPWTDGTTGLCIPYLLGQHSGSVARDVTERPVPTIATRGAIGLYRPQAFVLPRNGYHRGLHSNPAYDPMEQPLHTVTAKNHDGHVVTPYLVPFYSERAGQSPRTHDIDEPLPTVTATGSQPAVTRPYLIQYHGNSGARDIDKPLPTVTTRDSLALCLPEHYPWGLDIRFRMLQPRELAAAMGFPSDYEFAGTKTETVEQIGNAVPVHLAKSLIERLLAGRDPTLQAFASENESVATDGGDQP
ncbi:DNA cytosine methyltransferase (plasmid) [Halococcus dombrowskii]|jgi:DNA (cytosine-5)-methyltransferase 1|uniref:DNA (cytosine-5-)-methyltransferase n=2 Tax=Halococcus dombrowskii TaxID=179637 RepID=A0AAX3AS28_HALDO|nr:DNA cytosine methyltransferase [Halococcus dombrowskii]UOO96581.1 DNA cytosine methyltransferase [Halococcus dombrowskii]